LDIAAAIVLLAAAVYYHSGSGRYVIMAANTTYQSRLDTRTGQAIAWYMDKWVSGTPPAPRRPEPFTKKQ